MVAAIHIRSLGPLVTAQGAAMLSRRAVGTAVFGGMPAAAVIGILVIPMLSVVFQSLRERARRTFGRGACPPLPIPARDRR